MANSQPLISESISNPDLVPLDAILRTEELQRRPLRAPCYDAENRALLELAEALADSPRTILQKLADKVLELLNAHSSGLSLLTKDGQRFYWAAIAGAWKPHLGGGTPRNFGPCGDVLDCNGPLLFTHWELRYPYLMNATPMADEGLLVPFYVEGRAVGTIWAISHTDQRKFDLEDLRQLQNLGRFASAAYQAVAHIEAIDHIEAQLHQSHDQIEQISKKRREALSSLEDAIESRNNVERLNQQLQEEIACRKRADAEQRRLAAIVESSADAIISLDMDGDITSWNTGAERLYGYTAQGVIGHSISLLIPDGREDDFSAIIERIRRGEGMENYETERLAKDGRTINVSLTISPVKDDDGIVIGASKIARDISERVRAEKALKEADRRKDEFLATLAHELRNPMAPVTSAFEIIKHAPRDSELVMRCLTVMERQLRHMVRLIDDLMDVSRISRGIIRLRQDRAPIWEIVEHAIETSRPMIDMNGHHLTVELSPEPMAVNGDSMRLAQVISNLLNNAAKYTERGGQITLRTWREENNVAVSVKDTGIGIPSDMLPRVFEMFSQGDPSLSGAQGGLGIGLSLVKQLVEMHGGSVHALSAGECKGSEFIVRLPLIAGEEWPVAKASQN